MCTIVRWRIWFCNDVCIMYNVLSVLSFKKLLYYYTDVSGHVLNLNYSLENFKLATYYKLNGIGVCVTGTQIESPLLVVILLVILYRLIILVCY